LRPFALLAVAALACGGDDLGGPAQVRGIAIISGGEVTDSAGLLLTEPLVVEVHDSTGKVAPTGTLVRFTVVDTIGSTLLAPVSAGAFARQISRYTDNTRRTITGTVRIAIDAPTLGVADTARYTVIPGNAIEIILTPEDTAVAFGRPLAVRGGVMDKYRNVRPDPITWSNDKSGVSITPTGAVTATTVGRYRIIATGAGFTDTAMLSAVPQAVIAAVDQRRSEVVTIELDGSNRKVRIAVDDYGIGVRPRWLRGSDRIVYSTYNGSFQELRVVDATGGALPFLSARPATMTHQADAAPSPDGSWMYFAAHDTRCELPDYCLFRARLDGSNTELVAASANTREIARPSPSPDGRRVVFTTLNTNPSVVRVLDAESHTVMPWTVPGVFPQWSPVSEVIAYQTGDGELKLVNSDGSGGRLLAPGLGFYREGGFTWSPDGQWIVRRGGSGFELVVVSTGEVLPIRALDELFEPSWKY
jgi:Tol biopolymer transport system component